MSERVAFIGLGTMGAPMARNLLAGGHALTVFDQHREAADALVADGATAADSAADCVRDATIVITMVPTGAHVSALLFGEGGDGGGAAQAMKPGTLVCDMSTIAAAETDAIGERLAAMGHVMVDAPVGRSSQHAIDGKLLIMAGGDSEHYRRMVPLFELMGDTIVHCGPRGAGTRMKIVNNYMSITLNVLTAESLTLAEASGLDPELARKVMMGTVAGQGHMGTTYPAKVLNNDLEPGFMIDLAHKDLGLALALSGDTNVPAVTGAVAREVYSRARGQGLGRKDWTGVYALVRGDAASSSSKS